MYNPLLYDYDITIERIMNQVSSVMKVDVLFMQIPDGAPLARKREFVNARQISMKLSKEHTRVSLAQIGIEHGGRDHATVLHACKTVDSMIDTKDPLVYHNYMKLERTVSLWKMQRDNLIETGRKELQEDSIINTEK